VGLARFEPLASSHDLSGFECGHMAIDEYARSAGAMADQLIRAKRNYVLVDDESTAQIIGFISLCPYVLPREAMASSGLLPSLEIDHPSFVMLDLVGIDRRWQGRGYGHACIDWALETARTAADLVGSVGLLLSASPHLETFYASRGFRRIDGNPSIWPGEIVMFIPFD
jgi:GNAT superfamily N-acetyltransferase